MAFSAPEHQNRARRIPKKEAAHIKSRDFFKFAADMANPNIKLSFFDTVTSLPKRTIKSLSLSSLLDPAHQKCLIDVVLNSGNSKKSAFIFEEARVTDFHNFINNIHKQKNYSPINFQFSTKECFITHMRLFCAHRLRHKSLQLRDGVSSHIKYFHAQLWFDTSPASKINIVYWIKFDSEDNAIEGDTITIDTKEIHDGKNIPQ